MVATPSHTESRSHPEGETLLGKRVHDDHPHHDGSSNHHHPQHKLEESELASEQDEPVASDEQ